MVCGTERRLKYWRWALRFVIAVVVILFALICLSVLDTLAIRRIPSILAIHGDAKIWSQIDVESNVFKDPGSVVKVSPIGHGEYPIHIRFKDGRQVWASYFHSDAGVRRHVDVYADHKPDSGIVHLRCVIHVRTSVMHETSETVFDGDVNMAGTSKEKPAALLWI